MNWLFNKLEIGEELKKNFFVIMLVSAGGAIIYMLPYFRYDYYDAYMNMYNLSNTQIGVFGSIFGVFGFISYLFGGYVADRFSIRKIIAISLVGTGLGGFVHLMDLSFPALVALYAFWGFSSLFAFWPACIKAVRVLSDADGQGKAYGIFEGGRGIFAALTASSAVIVFKLGANKLGEAYGIKQLMFFYAVITTLCGILVFLFMKDETIRDDEHISFKDIKNVIKLPAVWIIAIVTFCNYVYTLSSFYFTPYSTTILGVSVAFGATLATSKRWIAPFSNVGGGYLGDKFGTSNLLLASFVIMIIGVVGILALPLNPSTTITIMYTVLFIISYLAYQVNSTITWAMMEEGAVPEKYSGTAAGLISTIGYLPDVFISILAGATLDAFPGVTGFRYFFGFLIAMLTLGTLAVMMWKRLLKKQKLAQ